MEVIEKQRTNSKVKQGRVCHVNGVSESNTRNSVRFKRMQVNGKKTIAIESPLLEEDNFTITHSETCINLIISEKKKIRKPMYVHHVKLDPLDFTSYERLKSYKYKIPKHYNEYIDTVWNKKKKRVEVYFK